MMEVISTTATFGGEIQRVKHRSQACDCDMIFGIFLPPQANVKPVPVLYWLSGLTCTDENFMIKAGAQRVGELPALVGQEFPVNDNCGISGHSMGGHGALICYLKNPGKYQSVSAFAPICNPSNCSWGQKAFSNYLGEDRNLWADYDASLLIGDAREKLPLLIDQGSDDEWFSEQLKTGALEQACIASHYPLELRMQEGYDHGYYFVATFIEDHLRHHAKALM
jgi:S-formylglutathione hydrolase